MSENHQSKIIAEIIDSEKSYLKQLEKLQNYFSKPSIEKGYLPSHVHTSIFSQLTAIYQMNSKLLEEIENDRENIGVAFLKFGPFLKVYSSYANNFQRALSILQEWNSNNEEFKNFIAITETRPEVQSKLTSLLITPIQRIPRYRLLLEELLKYTDSSYHQNKDITGALAQVRDAAKHINKSVDDSQSLQRLLVLQKALRSQQPSIIAPGRKLLKEGILNKVSRKGNGSQARIFFLFSDMLMYTKLPQNMSSTSKSNILLAKEFELKANSLECCCLLPLRYCRVTTLFGSNEQGITFRLQCADEDLLLYSSCSSEGGEWISTIKEAAHQALQKRKTLRKVSSKKKALRKPALRKLRYSEEDTPSPRVSKGDERLLKSPNKVPSASETMKARLLQVRDCLTPPRSWLTPSKQQKKPVVKSSEQTRIKAVHAVSSLASSSQVGRIKSPTNRAIMNCATNRTTPVLRSTNQNIRRHQCTPLTPSPLSLPPPSITETKKSENGRRKRLRPLTDLLSPSWRKEKIRKKE